MSVDCFYRKTVHSFLTIGQLHFINRTIVTKQTEDRDFLFRVITGKPLVEEDDEILYKPLETLFKDFESLSNTETQRKAITLIHNSPKINEICNEVTAIIKRIEDERLANNSEVLTESIKNSKAPEHVKHILKAVNKGVTGPNYYGMSEYVNTVVDFILNKPSNKYKQYEIISIVKYMVVGFIPKDDYDFPSGKMTDTQINELIHKTNGLSDDHPYKWTKKRKKLMEAQSSKYKRIVYTDDFLYLWKLYVVNTTPIQELTDFDIRTKYIIDTLLQKLSFEYSTERIIVRNMTDVSFKRFKRILNEIVKIFRNQYSEYFTIYNNSDILLEDQLKNQYILTIDEPKNKIEAKAKSSKNRRAEPQEIFTYLEKNEFIKPVKLFDIE